MNDPQLDTLFAQARTRRANTSAIEYGFETRLMARLREEKQPGPVWAMVLLAHDAVLRRLRAGADRLALGSDRGNR